MGRGADVVKARDRRAVVDRAAERAPEEELVDAAEPAIGIAADEIDVERFEIGGRIALCARSTPSWKPSMCEARIASTRSAYFSRSASVQCAIRRRRDLAGRVALDEARRFRQLQPQDRAAFRAAARIERGGLADADRRHRRQHAALRLVRRLGHAVETRRQMR